MIIFKQPASISKYLFTNQQNGKLVGFVPTMGALHQGHISLIEHAKTVTDIAVASIFVNPTQFNDPKDFEKYPVTIEADIEKLLSVGVDILFLPSVKTMYPEGTALSIPDFPLGDLETALEGKFRPGHFQGVCQVMDRLLHIVSPDELFMGRKDYQQCMVIDWLIRYRNLPARLEKMPTIREADGLAMSSRNLRLTAEQRATAPAIFQSLTFIKDNLKAGDTVELVNSAYNELEQQGFRPDYLEIVNAQTLEAVPKWNGTDPLVAIVAAFLGDIRLIDNLALN